MLELRDEGKSQADSGRCIELKKLFAIPSKRGNWTLDEVLIKINYLVTWSEFVN